MSHRSGRTAPSYHQSRPSHKRGSLYAHRRLPSPFSDVVVFDPTGAGHRYDPLTGKTSEDELLSASARLLFRPDEGSDAIFTQRATVMLTQLFLAAREEGRAPFPYVRHMIRSGLTSAAERLEAVSPELATQFLDVAWGWKGWIFAIALLWAIMEAVGDGACFGSIM